MLYSTFIIASFVALVSSTALPLPNINIDPNGWKVAKRGATPPGCNFIDRQDFKYQQLTNVDNKGGRACIGWQEDGFSQCDKTWGGDDFVNLQSAVAQQATKNGQFKSTNVGRWSATFLPFTFKFGEPNTQAFDYALAVVLNQGGKPSKSKIYWWSRNNDFMQVRTNKC